MNKSKPVEPTICSCSVKQIQTYGCMCGAFEIDSNPKPLTDDEYNDLQLIKEVEEKIADNSGYKTTDDVDADIEICPKCSNETFRVFQCDTGIWEVWAKCLKCGEIFCLGTE
jgi:hypothetical protein